MVLVAVQSSCDALLGDATSLLRLHRDLIAACSPLTSVTPKVFVPRKQGGSGSHHRGFAFVQCPGGAANAAALLAGLRTLSGGGDGAQPAWCQREASWQAARRKEASRRRGRGARRGRGEPSAQQQQPSLRGWRRRWRCRGGAHEERRGLGRHVPEHDFESDHEEDAEDAEGDEAGEEPSTASGAARDACVEAMSAFVAESRAWALGVQGFLVDHCRQFEHTEENKLEWHDLHEKLRELMEGLLEAELAKLGVAPDDFVARLKAASEEDQRASDLISTVLAMDDFVEFKRMMLKDDLDLVNLPQDTLDRFASGTATNWLADGIKGTARACEWHQNCRRRWLAYRHFQPQELPHRSRESKSPQDRRFCL